MRAILTALHGIKQRLHRLELRDERELGGKSFGT
jgi:hypothetical protein